MEDINQQSDNNIQTNISNEKTEILPENDNERAAWKINNKESTLKEETGTTVSKRKAEKKRKTEISNKIDKLNNSKTFTQLFYPLLVLILGSWLYFDLIPRMIDHIRFPRTDYITFIPTDINKNYIFSFNRRVPNLYYSVGNGKWEELGTNDIEFGGGKGNLRLKGNSIVGTDRGIIEIISEGNVYCRGDIRTLVNSKDPEHADTKDAVFSQLFKGCKILVSAPHLPAMELADECYKEMFSGCTSLETPPDLPSTKMATDCYAGMFSGCKSLKEAPTLSATELANSCYKEMFWGCKSLKEAPTLSATELANSCYKEMFLGCTSLTEAPLLPATKMADWCYTGMFYNCSSLETAPTIHAEKLANNCYVNMFSNCSSLSKTALTTEIITDKVPFTNWHLNTSTTGMFIKNKNATWDNEGIVPEGWKVVLVDPEEYK